MPHRVSDAIAIGTASISTGGVVIAQSTTTANQDAAWVTVVLAMIGLVTLWIRLRYEDREKRRKHDEAFVELQEHIRDMRADLTESKLDHSATRTELERVKVDLDKARQEAKGACKWTDALGRARCWGSDLPRAIEPDEVFVKGASK
jgi:hypothetical protein